MEVERLDPARVAALSAAPLTYSRVDVRSGSPAPGFRVLRRERVLRDADLDAAADRLLQWRVHTGAGLRVAASSDVVRLGAVVVLTLGVGRVGVRAACRVVAVVDEPDRRGFAYGTLPRHPECGEESFVLSRRDDGAVVFTVEAVSRPAWVLARLGGPLTRAVQSLATDRYLRAAG